MAAPVAAAAAAAPKASAILSTLGNVGSFLQGASGLFGSGGDNSNFVRHKLEILVKDAQKAGIHPLYAIGSAGGMPPMATGSFAGDALSSVGAAVSDIADRTSHYRALQQQPTTSANDAEQKARDAYVASMQADVRVKDAQAAYYASMVARNAAEVASRGRDRDAQATMEGKGFQVVPAQVTAGEGGRAAGPARPGMVEVEIPDTGGQTIYIPDQNLVEGGELIGPAMMIYRKLLQGVHGLQEHFKRVRGKGFSKGW